MASRFVPAKPRGVTWNGAGGCVIFSHSRQENFSRTVWITFHCRGIPIPPPRRNGGNIDNKELVAGTTLYLPIFTDGALFSVGDGHGAQGDGEVYVSAIETGLVGTFCLTLRNDMRLEWPLAETPTHMITMAFDPDLDDCVVIALRQMIDLICARTGLDRYQAYALSSLTADLRVTQVVNGNKGIHFMLDKRYLKRG
jgi:acetamidase/formamidase